jgi:hypothetical protein
MNKSAVEWAINEIRNNWYDYEYGDADMNDLIKQAKEMEKEQIKFFFDKGHLYSGCKYGFEEIYLKTFNQEQ